MYRRIIEQLREWKDREDRKPLVLAGARQVGKTYILKDFGKSDFLNVAYINCDDNDMAKDWQTIRLLKSQYIKALREYYFVGGMPEAVKCFIETNNSMRVRDKQNDILYTYQKDISKHVPTSESNRINMVWQSMPSQLVKENKKFIYGVAKPGGRAKDFEVAIQWLMDAGLVYKCERVNEPKKPLKFYVDIASFKLFLLDCGLLGAMSETEPADLLVAENGMEESKGAFTENFVMSQLVATRKTSVFYYSTDAKLELDFLIQQGSQIIPIEAKAEENLRSKSLHTFVDRNPDMHGLRFSMSDYREQDWMTNVPLYAASTYFAE